MRACASFVYCACMYLRLVLCSHLSCICWAVCLSGMYIVVHSNGQQACSMSYFSCVL